MSLFSSKASPFFIAGVLLIGFAFFFMPDNKDSSHMAELRIEEVVVHASIADSDEERSRGLSGRAGLGENEGLLFIFETPGKWSFWMKDMLFSIDIIWIGEDKRVVYLAEEVAPETYPTLFTPPRDALYVLEVRAGFIRDHGIAVGNRVSL